MKLKTKFGIKTTSKDKSRIILTELEKYYKNTSHLSGTADGNHNTYYYIDENGNILCNIEKELKFEITKYEFKDLYNINFKEEVINNYELY